MRGRIGLCLHIAFYFYFPFYIYSKFNLNFKNCLLVTRTSNMMNVNKNAESPACLGKLWLFIQDGLPLRKLYAQVFLLLHFYFLVFTLLTPSTLLKNHRWDYKIIFLVIIFV